ncbi:expressed protein [Arabidopsis lyrata subsp. lyrata]|uniref:Expressed protein n=1 Tax=Arabidopsis lyrata subsp. lyrata TaxID=81972 RepID=D7KMQ6_ARALL|nr:expressed protein [Arabidopsis lyrata subsp. lyrata]
MVVESVVLALWNSGIVLIPTMFLDPPGSTFVLSRGTLIALVRSFTAICRSYFELALLEAAFGQIGQRSLISFTVPVLLVHRGFHSPHPSFMELFILPNTSLVFSGIVTGSIIVKTVLLRAEARVVVQDSSRSAFVDCLTLEALFPPPCGFGKDFRFKDDYFIDCPCLDSALVELMSSPLSLDLYLSFVASFSFLSFTIPLLVVALLAESV